MRKKEVFIEKPASILRTPHSALQKPPLAAIDIGSNTIHLLVAKPGASGGWEHVTSIAELTELGRLVTLEGDIPATALPVIYHILEKYVAVARSEGAGIILIGATEAVRSARSGAIVVEKLSGDLGLPIRILSGERESQLGFMGAVPLLPAQGNHLLIDMGGGSTQISFSKGLIRLTGASLRLGSGILSVQIQNDPPSKAEWSALHAQIYEILSRLAPQGPELDGAIALGGCARNLLKLAPPRNGDRTLSLNEIDGVIENLLSHHSQIIAGRSDIDCRRIRLIAIGGLILSLMLRHYNLQRLRVSAFGLREGMLEAYRQWGDDWWREANGTLHSASRAGAR